MIFLKERKKRKLDFFALESYLSCWLQNHFDIEFCSLIFLRLLRKTKTRVHRLLKQKNSFFKAALKLAQKFIRKGHKKLSADVIRKKVSEDRQKTKNKKEIRML
jgi:hypothetical protein